ncbi:GRF1-interacting factor 3 [Oryza brachyantha]|uniref:GRF1-interacting factor 3 n=1 Tax=Oryza brachyantha TaxID=4533 RepID=UPI0003EAB26B|nr:GRF1-interacting factor 3 [Oryza brachyantha]
MQQPMPMPAQAPSMPPATGITTEQIQKYLDENKQLILAILENQNLGKLAECAQYQAQLQKNLLYLAAIADAQPQTTISRPQMVPPGGNYMSQVPMFPPRTPLTPQQMQEQQLQQQQAQLLPFAGQMFMRSGVVNGMPLQAEMHQAAGALGNQNAGATSEPSGTESHRSTGAENDAGSD